MIRPLAALLAASLAAIGAIGASGAPTAPSPAPAAVPGAARPAPAPGPAPLAERLGWNARERTHAGIRALAAGHAATAAAALDTALRLHPLDPSSEFNAGTGRLAAGRSDAVEPLERAAAAAGPGLAADAWYNLGNARLTARDARGAVDAYVESLRRDPARKDAKHNLELALRELERQRRQPAKRPDSGSGAPPQQKGKPQEADSKDGSRSPSAATNRDRGGAESTDPSAMRNRGARSRTTAGPADRPAGATPSESSTAATASARPRPDSGLSGYRDQPDLDAKQAAALLQAVENLERQQRRQRALERARARGEQDIDW